MKNFLYISAFLLLFTACNKDEDEQYYRKVKTDGTMELNGGEGGSLAKNSVYVQFSRSKQTSVERLSWHLALYCGSRFGVKLNNTTGSRAKQAANGVTIKTIISKTDYDTYKADLVIGVEGANIAIIDEVSDDISKTVIKKDKVYIYDEGENGGELYKVSVSEKNSSTYIISYAVWNSADVKTIEITKEPEKDFVGVSFTENKKVDIRPERDEWDMVWGRYTYVSAMAAGVPFIISDVVFLNTNGGVTAKEILVKDGVTYEKYTSEHAAAETLLSKIDVIGTKWRNGGSSTSKPSVKADRFYVIKDVKGNVYKLGFVSMSEGTDGGKRGYPEIKYSLLIAKQ